MGWKDKLKLYVKFGILLMKRIFIFFFTTTLLAVTGCSNMMKDTSDLLSNLSKSKESASIVNMMVYAEDEINLNASNEPTPVSFVVIELKNDKKLFALDYESLTTDLEDALGSSYITHEEYTVEPGKFINIDPYKLNEKTKFLGVVSAYRALENTLWRTSIKVKSIEEVYAIHTVLKKDAVKMESIQ